MQGFPQYSQSFEIFCLSSIYNFLHINTCELNQSIIDQLLNCQLTYNCQLKVFIQSMWLYSVEMKNQFAQLHTDLQNVSLIKRDLNTGLYDHVSYFS